MRKLWSAIGAAVVAAASLAVFATAAEGPGGTSWSFAFSPNEAQSAAGTNSVIEPAVRDDKGTPDDESDDTYAATRRTTILFPKGSAFDTSVPPRCNKTGGEVARDRGASCAKALIGSGDAVSLVGAQRFAATIKAYNKKNGIFFLIQPCQSGTGPGQANSTCSPLANPFVLEGKLGYKDRAKTIPRLIVKTPDNLIKQNIVIQRFALKTKKVTKRRRIGGRRVVVSYTLTPKRCKGPWKSSATMEYTGRPKLTIPATTPCSR